MFRLDFLHYNLILRIVGSFVICSSLFVHAFTFVCALSPQIWIKFRVTLVAVLTIKFLVDKICEVRICKTLATPLNKVYLESLCQASTASGQ